MTRVTVEHGPTAPAEVSVPRDDWLVREYSLDERTFGLDDGPFTHWERRIETLADGTVVEHVDFRLATPGFATAFGWPLAWAIRHRKTHAPFWAPPHRFDARGARSFTWLIVATLVAAYLGTLLSQTITFVADEFDAGEGTQGLVLSLTRIGALLALVAVAAADRVGRRRMIVVSAVGSAVFAAVAALSPSIWFFGSAELVSRGFATSLGLLVGIVAAEESPAGSRAWTVSVLALFAGLGSGAVLWLVPVADSGEGRWRWLFAVALLIVPIALVIGRNLTESRRFERQAVAGDAERAPITARMRRRFALLAIVSFATSAFAAPSSNFQNEYLREVRGFSGARISLFSSVTSTPIGIGVAIFGPIADRRGRRLIGAIGIFAGVVFNVVRYGFGGPLMWIAGTLSTIIGAAAIPALGVYGPELFPTSRRGLANGLLTCVSVVGSVVGLTFVGFMIERYSYGFTFALLAIVPLVAIAAIRWYPETARQRLEDLNPEDQRSA